ncbi:MAG: acetolactate decarboxylase [Phycisphaerales bacterium]|nr:acetolactate decarboxylase [Phycisphaerales bacterium]MCB9856598.1 acetolactate decarboxylase [Phycisphaerales bacterium]MCB9864605.1 acetolactate decarboxylase [Phycisphaerales bacterium]
MTTRKLTSGLVAAIVAMTAGCAANRVEVTQYGQMHKVLSGGAGNAKGIVGVDNLLKRPNAIGVGALAGLEGEITISDGKAWIARPDGQGLRIEVATAAANEQASMMTVSYVDAWRDVPIDRDLAGEALESFIGEQAAASGIDTGRPFPFMLAGSASDLQLHVIHGACPMRPGGRLTPDEQPWRLTIDRLTPCRVVGFYAQDSVGKLTHPGTSIHAHALLSESGREITGHIERIAMARGGVLKLPMVR